MTLYRGKADVQKFVGTLNLLRNLSMIIHPLTELAVLIPLQLGTSARWLIQERPNNSNSTLLWPIKQTFQQKHTSEGGLGGARFQPNRDRRHQAVSNCGV